MRCIDQSRLLFVLLASLFPPLPRALAETPDASRVVTPANAPASANAGAGR